MALFPDTYYNSSIIIYWGNNYFSLLVSVISAVEYAFALCLGMNEKPCDMKRMKHICGIKINLI